MPVYSFKLALQILSNQPFSNLYHHDYRAWSGSLSSLSFPNIVFFQNLKFETQATFRTIEIHDVLSYCNLPSKLQPMQLRPIATLHSTPRPA